MILVADEAQRRAAEASAERVAARLGRPVSTAIEPLGTFTRAEDYHQKFTLRGWKQVAAELLAIYPDERAFTDSSAATRLNAYLAGQGRLEDLERELPQLGLSEAAAEAVRQRVRERARR